MKKIFKKNQIIVTMLAVLIAVAGYVNYTYDGRTPAKKANNEVASQKVDVGQAVLTNGQTVDSYIDQVKLNKEQTRSKNKETLLEVIDNENMAEEQKKSAVEAMVKITENSQLESDIENLLKSKGVEHLVVIINEQSVEVIINEMELNDTVKVQIEDIIKRKTGIDPENIIITPTNNQE